MEVKLDLTAQDVADILNVTGHDPKTFFLLRLGDVVEQNRMRKRQELADKILKADNSKLDQINTILE